MNPSHAPGAGPPRARAGAPPGRVSLSEVLLRCAAALAIALLVTLFAVPLAALVLRVSPAALVARLGDPALLAALRLSVVTALLSTALACVLGLPVAYVLATRSFPGKRLLEVLVELPMVMPPTVAGLALLMAFGRAGLLGRQLHALGVQLPFTTLGVVVAQVFMSAPFFISPATAGFASVDRRYRDIAATLGATETWAFFRIMLPLSLPSLVAGATMSCARALGEFGATITFAGNLPGSTQTMPLAVYMAMENDLQAAVVLAILLVALSVALLLGLRHFNSSLFWNSARAARHAD